MRTLRSAAILLANTTSVECCGPLLADLGFSADLVTLDTPSRERLGIGPELSSAYVSPGTGAMRALVGDVASADSMRAVMSRLAARLSSRTPHVLWLMLLINRETAEIALGCWYTGKSLPRIVALVASQRHTVDSDCETLCAMADAASESDIATHARWLEILGRESVSRRFFRAMQSSVSQLAAALIPSAPERVAIDLSLLYLSRLLFLSFLETKSWLNGDHAFLANQFADCMLHGGKYHTRVLAPLFFGTLNTRPTKRAQRARAFGRVPFLNGGLFSRSAVEKSYADRTFSDEALGDVFGDLLTRYRFTACEESSVWSEAAVDPEMLGKAFESLMAPPERKTTGAFYTPQLLVEQLTTSALAGVDAARELKVLDPACGSGAFLVHCLERLAALRVHLGDLRPVHVVRREILTRSIFGVDVNPTAVWLCELRLWLSTAILDPERDPLKVVPLPNLDRNIRVGDSLSGGAFHSDGIVPQPARIASVRARYTRAVGKRKVAIARRLDRLERECAVARLDQRIAKLAFERKELVNAERSRDLFGARHSPTPATLARLANLRDMTRSAKSDRRNLVRGGALPFSFETQFADVSGAGGFDIVVGNPPWVRRHNVSADAKKLFAREFSTFRQSAWLAGAQGAAAGRGFAAQVDLAALFIERSVSLARTGGVIALLAPSKLWRSLAGGGVRCHVLHETRIDELHDLTESHQLFDAAVYPSLLVVKRKEVARDDPPARPLQAVVHRGRSVLRWNLESRCLPFDDTPGSPWILVPPEVREAFDKVRSAGICLTNSSLGRPLLGVKTGCNEAFVVRVRSAESNDPSCEQNNFVTVELDERAGLVERELLRPLHRGETLRAWRLQRSPEQIIWTHRDGRPLARLPAHAQRWLAQWRRQLELRTDARGRAAWWTIFRTESAAPDLPRVAWSDFGRAPRAAVIDAGDPAVLINSCYVARCATNDDAYALAALLNSPLMAAWLNTIAEPARGGYHRYLGWTVALMPIPFDWTTARRILAPLAQRAIDGDVPGPDALLATTLRAYGLRERQVEPLLLWNSR